MSAYICVYLSVCLLKYVFVFVVICVHVSFLEMWQKKEN